MAHNFTCRRETIAGDNDAIRLLDHLQSFRKNMKLSKTKLARLTGLCDDTIRNIELHHITLENVSVYTYNKLAAFFAWNHDHTDCLTAFSSDEQGDKSNLEEKTPSYDWEDIDYQSLKINASKMFNMLNRIASENQVWTVGEVKRLLASVSKVLTHLG